jgi:class 3 adenylate cyclase/predicted nucleic acid-binding protein
VVYLDSSALVKLVIAETESPALRRYLAGEPDRASCALARVEVLRAVRAHGSPALTRARRLVQRLNLVPIDEELLDAAAALDPRVLRSLDAIHLAAALLFGGELTALVTYDRRMAAAAAFLDLAVAAPRRSSIRSLAMVSPPSAPTGDLLVVDDNRVNRLLLGRALEQLGHTVTFAENGRQALEALRRRPVDLVLLDIEMPEMDGYQVLEALAGDPQLREIPVVMMSSVEEVDSVARCIEMGAEDYLFKPVNPVLLKARIGSSLEKKRLRDRQRELFRRFATAEVADELLASGMALGAKHVEASVMFSDIRGSTRIAEVLSPAETIELLNSYYTLMFDAIGGHGGIVNQIIGDGLMAIFGAPLPQADHRERAVRAALEMLELVEGFSREQARRGAVEIRIGIGIASGPLVAGFTGTERRMTYTCVGDAVNLAAHLETHTKVVGQPILIDENTRRGLGDGIRVESHGAAQLKTRSQPVPVYSVPPGQRS